MLNELKIRGYSVITVCNDLLIRLKLSLRKRLLKLVGERYFYVHKATKGKKAGSILVKFLISYMCLKFYQLLLVMYLKQIYSVKLHRNLAMNLIATTIQAIPKWFALIGGQGVSG